MTRMATSRGFSVSSRSIRRLTSGILDFCAATMRRLESLSGQMRTGWAGPPAAALPEDELLLLDGGGGEGVGPSDMTTPEERELLDDEDDLDDDDDEELEGGAGCELSTSVSSA